MLESLLITLFCNFIKKRLQHRCFPVNIAKYLRSFFIEHLQWFGRLGILMVCRIGFKRKVYGLKWSKLLCFTYIYRTCTYKKSQWCDDTKIRFTYGFYRCNWPVTKGITLSDDELISLRARKPTDNLSSSLELKFGARVMLINNIDISDKLIKDRLVW